MGAMGASALPRVLHASRTLRCRTQSALRQFPATVVHIERPMPSTHVVDPDAGRDAVITPSVNDVDLMHRRSFYQRKLPPQLVAFSSAEGRERFLETVVSGYGEAYFPLSEQFVTQTEPFICGPACLAMVLNTLRIDPNTTWKGGWRWFDERTLASSCCKPMDVIEKEGITLDEFAALGRCQGAVIDVHRPLDASDPDVAADVERFRDTIMRASSSSGAPYLIVSFLRTTLGQTGTGHFSPIAAYHQPTDSCLVLDIARFKLPPYWVPVPDLYAAMVPVDSETGLPRGYALMSAGSSPQAPGTERSMAQLGGGGGRCALSAIKREFCPVWPRRSAQGDSNAVRERRHDAETSAQKSSRNDL
uniref:glutathione gamma-glutamylcysteinyltransferase n=1 Tax=Coccolithus braarudii TaxID=221442 RepID=A0A7S0L902_9EUKA